MSSPSRDHGIGVAAVLFSSVVWGTTGTAATFAPEVGPAAIGAAAMGVGGLLQALLAGGRIARALPELARHWRNLLPGGLAVAIYPLAFYASMRLAGVTIGTVVTIGSAPLLSALIDLLAAHTHPTGVGPSGPPANAASITGKKADIDGTLSPIIKGR